MNTDDINNFDGKFTSRLADLLVEINYYKLNPTAIFSKQKKSNKFTWKAEYDILTTKIKELQEISQFNQIIAKNKFRTLEISNFETFKSYLFNKDIDVMNSCKGSAERTKLLRAKRKSGKKCPECKSMLISSQGNYICKKCGYNSSNTDGSFDYRSNTDSSKHTFKHIDAISGTKKAPLNIIKISKYISVWLTDFHYISDWLIAEKRFPQFIKKFNEINHSHETIYTFPNIRLQRKSENMLEYSIYKMFTDELYNFLEKAKRLSKQKSSNMESLEHDLIKQIVLAYIDSKRKALPKSASTKAFNQTNINKNSKLYQIMMQKSQSNNDSFKKDSNKLKIPDIAEKFVFNDVEYEIGLYFNTLSLYADPIDFENYLNPDYNATKEELFETKDYSNLNNVMNPYNLLNCQQEININPKMYENNNFVKESSKELTQIQIIKHWIEQQFGYSISLPGLMFNFNDIYYQSDNVPKRYNFTQEYIYVSHETFNIQYVNISHCDRVALVNLIMSFNEFYKKYSFSRNGKDCNAPLFCCSLVCILNFYKYFSKYADILKFIPMKDKNTSGHIKSIWFKFTNAHPEYKKSYGKVINQDMLNEYNELSGIGLFENESVVSITDDNESILDSEIQDNSRFQEKGFLRSGIQEYNNDFELPEQMGDFLAEDIDKNNDFDNEYDAYINECEEDEVDENNNDEDFMF